MGQAVPVLHGRLPLGVQIDRGHNGYVPLLSLHDASSVQQTVLGI